MNKIYTLTLQTTSLSMVQKIRWMAPALLLCLCNSLFAQTEHPLTKAFSSAISRGDIHELTALLDEEVELMQPGEKGTFRKQAATGKLAVFLRQNPPVSFLMKHQGSSADGQVYVIGQLTTNSGSNYKVLLRAKPSGGAQHRIFKLDFLQNL